LGLESAKSTAAPGTKPKKGADKKVHGL
jgi:hypothetical protein